jgi:hypothetical protein
VRSAKLASVRKPSYRRCRCRRCCCRRCGSGRSTRRARGAAVSGGARACTGADVIPRMPTLGRYARGCGEPPSHRSSPPARLPAAYPTPTRALPRACVRACWCVKTSTACVCCVLTGRSRLSREPTSSSSVAAVKSVEIPACGSRCARPQPRVLAQHVPACACACACACTCAYMCMCMRMHMCIHAHVHTCTCACACTCTCCTCTCTCMCTPSPQPPLPPNPESRACRRQAHGWSKDTRLPYSASTYASGVSHADFCLIVQVRRSGGGGLG